MMSLTPKQRNTIAFVLSQLSDNTDRLQKIYDAAFDPDDDTPEGERLNQIVSDLQDAIYHIDKFRRSESLITGN